MKIEKLLQPFQRHAAWSNKKKVKNEKRKTAKAKKQNKTQFRSKAEANERNIDNVILCPVTEKDAGKNKVIEILKLRFPFTIWYPKRTNMKPHLTATNPTITIVLRGFHFHKPKQHKKKKDSNPIFPFIFLSFLTNQTGDQTRFIPESHQQQTFTPRPTHPFEQASPSNNNNYNHNNKNLKFWN